MTGAGSMHGGDEKCIQILVRRPEGKTTWKEDIGAPCRREGNVRMDLREIG
jgi:hypothetical protein